MKEQRGFTLIELLVVIAIIGILSAVVLASLSTARSKGNDAGLESDLNTIQTQAEIYYGGTGANSYGATVSNTPAANSNTCPNSSGLWADTTIKNAVLGAASIAKGGTITCNSTGSNYAIQAQLNAPAGTVYWCVDSTGRAATSSTQLLSGVVSCP